eukprot:NODE_1317_length_1360_cov_0.987312.p1 type:complete len:407 gc:universal NODE_1317_length_1360_cov_0.987312:1338-118(-)
MNPRVWFFYNFILPMPTDSEVPDEKFILMYNMLTGIRIGVSRCENKQEKPLDANDYIQAHKLAFDITGQELTPTQKYDFKFKDYSPLVFRKLRQLFRVDVNDYLHSLTGKYVLSERGSPGKSGSFFYFSHDYRFIIKTIHHVEHKLLLKILPSYVEHVQKYPHTLLSRFFGLHRVKEPGGRKIHFVVMQNLFPPNKDVHEIYDLKGSTFGRFVTENENKKQSTVLKDLNWRDKQKHLELGPKKRSWLFKQIEIDVEILMKLEIMDYSLLIGVHNIRRGNIDHLRESMLKVLEPDPSTFKGRRTTMGFQHKSPSAEIPARKTLDIPVMQHTQSVSQPGTPQPTPMPTPVSPSRPASPFGTQKRSNTKLAMVRRAFTATDDEIEKLSSNPSSPSFPQEMIFNEYFKFI